ncbi:GNAT family N-acetyltransferase [Agromyces seonyuensis]|uniref:GNAT family N-acetyltransferase n=1 Tax=Agromyces seonyuensis TaxID=2662446 RepID=A0A6I4P0M4_9MICO|nr:GNAT family N-acetyltransferase [Agromyces seonyuensis]MWC00087.1 GNAT family N-acetyltransferase [Agromyces seonyuensis]
MTTEALPPLAERVHAPEEPSLPEHPEVVLWRSATLDDVDAIFATQRAAELADHPDFLEPREHLVDDLTGSNVDLARDSMLALDGEGNVLAWGLVWLHPGRETRVQSHLWGTVRPDVRGRGIGRSLLEWQIARSRRQLAGLDSALPAWTHVSGLAENTSLIRLAESFGLRIVRWFTEMERPVADPIPEIALDEGVRLVPYEPELSEATRLARNDAFRDHWGSQSTDPERWAKFTGAARFRADLSRLVVADDPDGGVRVIAFALASVNEEEWAGRGRPFGYIDLIGVRREGRGRRLAPAVMAAQLRAFAAAGLEDAVLDVDTENPSGALGLYERMGYAPGRREVALVTEY